MKTFVIAEIGINHDGDLQRAKDLVYAAKDCGCSAVKFQSYATHRRVPKDSPIFDILKKCEMGFDQQKELKEYADSVGVEFISTPFDENFLAFLVVDLGIKKVKLASFDVTNSCFLDSASRLVKNHPFEVILSTGMADLVEIDEAVKNLKEFDYAGMLTILHCVSSYPLHPRDANLAAIKELKKFYPRFRIGYSDHTGDALVPALSVLAGAEVVEKHFTLDKNGPGVDNPVSIDPTEMKSMIAQIETFEQILGDGVIGMRDVEKAARQFRRTS